MTHTPTPQIIRWADGKDWLVLNAGTENRPLYTPIGRIDDVIHCIGSHKELVEALKVAKYALADGWTEASTKATRESIENAIKITTKAIQEAEGKP
jgi:hypothetical protein